MKLIRLIVVFVFFFASCKTGQKAVASSTGKNKVQPVAAHAKLDQADQTKLEQIFMDAEKAKAIEDWDNAIKNYNDVLTMDPANADAYFQLAKIYIGIRKLEEAEQAALAATKLDGNNRWYAETLAEIYMNEGKNKEAVDTYRSLIDKFPNDPDYYLNLGYVYSKEGQFDNAIKVYDQFEKNFGIDENLVMEKKNIYLHMNRFNDAMNEVQKLVDAFPGETEYLLMEADMYAANKMKDNAAEEYKKVLAIEPDNAQALLALAEIGVQNGNVQQSNEDIKKIFRNPNVDVDTKVKILFPYLQYWDIKKAQKQDAFDLAEILTTVHPSEAKAFAIKGDLYYMDGQNDKALDAYRHSLQLSQSVIQVWQQVMLLYNIKHEWDSLLNTCNQAMELFPNQAYVYLFKGGAEFQLKQYDNALRSYSKGLKMSGDDDKLKAQFWANMGDTYHSLNRADESDSAYESALKLDPDNAYVLNNYSYYLSVRKLNLERAKEMSAYSNKLDPDNSSFLDTYAWILFQLGDFPGAKEWQEKAMKANGDKSGNILEHYGDILYELGKKDDAVDYWKKAKELGTDSGTIDRKINEQKYVE